MPKTTLCKGGARLPLPISFFLAERTEWSVCSHTHADLLSGPLLFAGSTVITIQLSDVIIAMLIASLFHGK